MKQTAKSRTRVECTRPNVKSTQVLAGQAGPNTVAFNGTVGKKLGLGECTLTASGTDPPRTPGWLR